MIAHIAILDAHFTMVITYNENRPDQLSLCVTIFIQLVNIYNQPSQLPLCEAIFILLLTI